MKLSAIIILLSFFNSFASDGYSQTISIKANNIALSKVMKTVQRQSGIPFFLYGKGIADLNIMANIENLSLEKAMSHLLEDQPVEWLMLDGTILVRYKIKVGGQVNKKQEKQERWVSGRVNDNKGLPLSGVSVSVKGTSLVTKTDEYGDFKIALPEEYNYLSFSMLGFANQQVYVKSNNPVNIILLPSVSDLEEVVVVGYGTVSKRDLTGSVSSVHTNDLKDIPSNSIESLLQGRAAGLQIVKTSQDPGAGATVRIRGGSSLRGSNAPLIVVDGFPLGDAGNLKQINPMDIVSVEVLKDASASSIYGSRGANGVIMITTKKAKTGSTDLSVKHQTTVNQFSSKIIQWTDPAIMAQLDNEAKINGGMSPLYIGAENSTGTYYPSVQEILNGDWPYFTDWSKVVFRETPLTNTSTVSLASANERTSVKFSANNFIQQGTYIKDDYNKQIANLSLKHQFTKALNISSFNNLSRDRRQANGGLAYWRNPLWPVYKDDGDYFLASNVDYDHPIALTEFRKNINKGTDFISSWLFDLKLLEGLSLKSQLNYKYGASIQDRYDPDRYTQSGSNNKGAAFLDNWMGQVYTADTYITYNRFVKKHDMTAMLGHSYEHSLSRSSALESYSFKNGALNNENMGSGAPELNRHRNGQTLTKLLSYFGRLNYAYDNKYLLTMTVRADGSSKFSKNNKWAYFPSGAVSWKIHEEDFVKDLNIFDELKLRASYGISGNQGISPYQTLSRYGIETFYNQGSWNTAIGPGYVIGFTGVGGRYKEWGGIPNEDLKWETTAQYNLGLDFSLWKNRIAFTVDLYTKNTYDLLRERFLSLSSGYDRIWVNDGEIQNRGVEFAIDANIFQKKDWDVSANLIFTHNKNKVVNLGNALSSGLSKDYLTNIYYEYYGGGLDPFRETSSNILAVGLPVNVFYGYKVSGIIQTAEEGVAAGLSGAEARPGEYRYVDLNQDGVFDTKDRTIIGDPNPDFLTSLNLKARYKSLDVSVFFNAVIGHDIIWNGMYNSAMHMPLRWTPDNPTNEYPSARQGRLYYTSDWFIKDGSFVRFQNANVGYTFDSFAKWGIKQLRLSLNAENLHTFTKFKGYDPEVGLNGRYGGGYPKLRMFTFGIDFNF
ncbi:SusC/RagA family TonB-linked outer membrane protein [Sphingobacterium faecale]|uniref:TonB-dependent receptor n=1 Tax=Sphingobacterium faecale TaxID=2803775 RepID=A0ABS1R0T3_9SPHI|nr:TonB-dependent receptor [Sphingobacterium faecale]MBL1408273.1 TonB-dependent receptor [Sphingobacterium faecale]